MRDMTPMRIWVGYQIPEHARFTDFAGRMGTQVAFSFPNGTVVMATITAIKVDWPRSAQVELEGSFRGLVRR